MNPNGTNLLLIKVVSRQDYVSQFLSGNLYSQRLDCFRKMENDQQRGDKYEGTVVFPPDSILSLQSTDLLTKETNVCKPPLDDLAGNITLQRTALKYLNVFCMYAVDFNDFKKTPINDTKATLEVPEMLWEFGDYAVVVFDVPKFISRARKAARFLNYRIRLGRVTYYNAALGLPNVPLDESVAFFKRDQFAHQKEFRLAFNSFTVGCNPITVSVGDISDIAMPVTRNNMHQELSIEIITNSTPTL